MPTKRTSPRESPPSVRSGKDSGPGGTRRLPPEFDRLAAGDDRLPPRARPQDARVRDPRELVLIPGTNNRDCRHVYDARLSHLRKLIANDDPQALGVGLLEFCQLGLYRARNVVDMDAFSTSVLGLAFEQARGLLETAASERGQSASVLAEPLVALWIRTEAALREQLGGEAQITLIGQGAEATLQLTLPCNPVNRTVDALCAVGRQAAGLGRHLASPAPENRIPRDRRPTVPQRPPLPPRRPAQR